MIAYTIEAPNDISKVNHKVKERIETTHSRDKVSQLLEVSRVLIERSKNGDFDLGGNRKTMVNIAKSEFVMCERLANKKLKYLGCKNTI